MLSSRTLRFILALLLLGASKARADLYCTYDSGSLCLTAADSVGRVPAEAFKGPKKPLLVLVNRDKSGAATKRVFLILTEESGAGPEEAARAGIEEIKLVGDVALHPDPKPAAVVLRKGLTAYGYGNGCAGDKCRPMSFLVFRAGRRVLKAAFPPDARKACREALATLAPAEGKP